MTLAGTEQRSNYKVFIPCAGTGSRLGEKTKLINKSLLSVGNKPVISHIVEKFKDNVEIVVALGFKGSYVRQFLELSYPEKKFTFVDVEKLLSLRGSLNFFLLVICFFSSLKLKFPIKDSNLLSIS